MLNIVKYALERGSLEGIRSIKRGNIYRRSLWKWIEACSIFGNLDAFVRIGIEAVGGVTCGILVGPEENPTARELLVWTLRGAAPAGATGQLENIGGMDERPSQRNQACRVLLQ